MEKPTDLSQVTDKLNHIIWSRFELTTSVVIGTDCIGSCKSKYHTITATTAPLLYICCVYLCPFALVGYCVVCSSLIYRFFFTLWYFKILLITALCRLFICHILYIISFAIACLCFSFANTKFIEFNNNY